MFYFNCILLVDDNGLLPDEVLVVELKLSTTEKARE